MDAQGARGEQHEGAQDDDENEDGAREDEERE